MATTVGSRELKTRLGTWLSLVRDGQTLIVTHRGKPVAEIRPIPQQADQERQRLSELAALGEVALPTRSLDDASPVAYDGPSLSSAILDDRGDRV